jgi:putative glutathione S-transferase
MGRLIEGVWSDTPMTPDERGQFVRGESRYRGRVSEEDATDDRYELIVAYACGWCHRTLLWRSLLGLEAAVPLCVVDPFCGERGWILPSGEPLYEIYRGVSADYTGAASVPVLWDKKRETIALNESLDIVASFEGALSRFAKTPRSYFPEGRVEEIAAMVEANYGPVQNGVYKAGFASSQEAHEEASRAIFARLDELEILLSEQRYLLGNELTAADWHFFPTLYRFDTIYHVHFKCTLHRLVDYPSLWAYTRDLYQHPGVRETCHMEATKQHYYRSHESVHPRRYIPLGPALDFDAPHGRD